MPSSMVVVHKKQIIVRDMRTAIHKKGIIGIIGNEEGRIMGKWEETYPTTGALRKALKNARRVGGLKGGQDRVEFIGPLLDAIVDQSYKWSPEQCACFSEKLL